MDNIAEQRYDPYKRVGGLYVPETLAAELQKPDMVPGSRPSGVSAAPPSAPAPKLSRQVRRRMAKNFAVGQVNNLFAGKRISKKKALLPQVAPELAEKGFVIPKV